MCHFRPVFLLLWKSKGDTLQNVHAALSYKHTVTSANLQPFIFLHWAETFIQSELHCIQCMHFHTCPGNRTLEPIDNTMIYRFELQESYSDQKKKCFIKVPCMYQSVSFPQVFFYISGLLKLYNCFVWSIVWNYRHISLKLFAATLICNEQWVRKR